MHPKSTSESLTRSAPNGFGAATVFLFIFHHSHIADLLNTEYIKYLATRYKVVVFLPKREGRASLAENEYYKHENVEYREQELLHEKWWYRFKLLRTACIRQFDSLVSVRWNYDKNKYTDWRRTLLRRMSLLVPKSWMSTRTFTWLEGRMLPDEIFFKDAVAKYKPRIVLTATPGFTPFDAWAVLLAKKHRVPTCSINFTWDNLTSNGKFMRKTDYLVVWNGIIKQEALDYHRYTPESVFVSGPLRFDPYFTPMQGEMSRETFLRTKGLDPGAKTILIGTMTDNNYSGHVELIEYVLKLRDSGAIEPCNIFVRVHPIDHFNKYEGLIARKIKHLHIERAGTPLFDDRAPGQKVQMNQDDMRNLKHTLKYCDLCVNPFSTLSIEAMIFDKPVINLGLIPKHRPSLEYVHYKPLIDSGSVRVAYTDAELEEYLTLYLAHPETDREERRTIVQKYVGYTDGLSYKRSVDALDTILRR